MATAIINIGSCKGRREALIERAAALVASLDERGEPRRSAVIETPAWGYESSAMFLNLGMAVETSLAPLEILDRLQAFEKSIDPSPHRDASGNYIDRAIDIDFIALDDLHFKHPRLTLPHPRMHLRRFVVEPFMQLEPDLCSRLVAEMTDGDV